MKKWTTLGIMALAILTVFGFTKTSNPLPTDHGDGGIHWMSVEEMQEAQKKEPRKVMIDVYTKWCGPCKMMMKNTFTNADVIDYLNDNYYAVKFDAESPDDIAFKDKTFSNPTYDAAKKGRNGVNEFSRFLGVRAYPTLVYMDSDLSLLQAIPGYQTPQQLELFLKLFAEDRYKGMDQDSFNAYKENFVNEFEQ